MISLLSLLLTQTAFAVDTKPVTNATVAASSGRIGLQADLQYGVRFPMFEKEDSALFQGTGLKTLATASISPSHGRVGGRLSFTPLAIMDVNIHGAYDQYFGNFQTVVGYPSADFNYGSNDDIAAYVEDTGNQAVGSGHHYGAHLVLKAKAGPVIVLASTDVTHWDVNSQVEGDWFFEREKELMLAFEGDNVIDFNGLALYQLDLSEDRWLRLGSFTTWRKAFASEDELLRSGVLCSYSGGGAVSHNLVAQPYLKDRAYDSPFPIYAAYAFKYSK
jgi:hypothetical protein